jgi:regulator of replication initiation timing
METTLTQLLGIQQKLQLLLKKQDALQKENSQLKAELEKLRSNTSSQAEEIQKLKQQLTVKNLQTGNWSDDEKKELEQKINSYLKEVDKCLNLLNT